MEAPDLIVTYNRMKEGQEGQVSELIHGLIADYGTTFQSQLTPESLRASSGFLNVEVAECEGRVIGICAWVMSFSTWRGTRGMHVADHFVARDFRHTGVAHKLLHNAAAAAAAEGATFIRTEVDISDEASEKLYAGIGFWNQLRHMLCFLEPDKFKAFLGTDPA